MRRALFILTLLLATTSLTAQNFTRRGFSLGADRDTMLYVIASPFDNWYITFGGGPQTFIGNEIIASARHNKLNYNGRVEIGKWIIPDLSVAVRASLFNVDGQSQYGLQPFINKSEDTPNENGYYPFHAHALAVMGIVTMDWTNLFNGYEVGKRTKLHIYTPIGLGFSVLFGWQRNPRGEDPGSFRRNFELSYTGGLGLEYEISQKIALNFAVEVFGSESTWDWSPYDNSYSRFDIIPSLSAGVRFNLLHKVTKFNPYTRQTSREKVNHEFLSYGTRQTVNTLTGRIETLSAHIDSVQNLSDHRGQQDSLTIAVMTEELASLQALLDSTEGQPRGYYRPANVMEELINMIPVNNLPAAIVYFPIDKYDLDFNGRRRLQNFAKELAQMDDTVEFFVIGAADSATGSVRRNQWLSERRSEVVYNALVNYYDADPNQLTKVPVGGIAEYEMQENNRMTLVILRNKDTEAVIQKWMNKKRK